MAADDPFFLGIDGCRAGWVAVGLFPDRQWRLFLYRQLESLWEEQQAASLLFIDIPIGLPENQAVRDCDLAARSALGKRRSSVFAPPVRSAVYQESYPAACEANARRTGKKISIQAWNIVPKIVEADQFLSRRPCAKKRLLEAHPEINFLALAGHSMSHNKKKPIGYRERLEALIPHCSAAEKIIQSGLEEYPRKWVARDDLTDALCLAVNARLAHRHGLWRLPGNEPPLDAIGLPMQIVAANVRSLPAT